MKRFYTNIPVNKKPRRKTSIKLTAFMLAALCLMFVLKYATGANSGLEHIAAAFAAQENSLFVRD